MKRLAFIMGYRGPAWAGPLQYTSNDVRLFSDCLLGECDFEIKGPVAKADSFDVGREISRLASACGPEDDLILYFSGHGELKKGELFLLMDESTSALLDSAIPTTTLVKVLQHSEARNKLLILDCCHAGAATGLKGPVVSGPAIEEVFPVNPSFYVLCASARLESAK